jgi:hypothetical protein
MTSYGRGYEGGSMGDLLPIQRGSIGGRAFLERRSVHVEDVLPLIDTEYPDVRALQARNGFRTVLGVPMLRDGESIGVISLLRNRVQPFTPAEIGLLQTFADQAVIAIENTRLFNETQEALEQQTATAEILQVISGSPTDVRPVFDAIAERARVLCGADYGATTRFDGELLHMVGYHGVPPKPRPRCVRCSRASPTAVRSTGGPSWRRRRCTSLTSGSTRTISSTRRQRRRTTAATWRCRCFREARRSA